MGVCDNGVEVNIFKVLGDVFLKASGVSQKYIMLDSKLGDNLRYEYKDDKRLGCFDVKLSAVYQGLQVDCDDIYAELLLVYSKIFGVKEAKEYVGLMQTFDGLFGVQRRLKDVGLWFDSKAKTYSLMPITWGIVGFGYKGKKTGLYDSRLFQLDIKKFVKCVKGLKLGVYGGDILYWVLEVLDKEYSLGVLSKVAKSLNIQYYRYSHSFIKEKLTGYYYLETILNTGVYVRLRYISRSMLRLYTYKEFSFVSDSLSEGKYELNVTVRG